MQSQKHEKHKENTEQLSINRVQILERDREKEQNEKDK